MIRQFELVELVRSYNADVDEDLLNQAYVYGVKVHGHQTRANGEPYFNHPVEVAAILTRYRVDDATIATALLHDTLEDTVATFEELETRFTPAIAAMVEGVTKLSKLKLISNVHAQAENLRKLLVAMAKDPRVLLVKMADRLHNMRTICHLRPDKQIRISQETLDIFAPLAARMGLQNIREELEDRAFAVISPQERQSIIDRVLHLERTAGEGSMATIIEGLAAKLKDAQIEAKVTGRVKQPFGIWRKIQHKGVRFEQLSDVIAFRIVTAHMLDCYKALGVIHRDYHAVQGRFKDYISNPKTNGYRSIHTTVLGAGGAHIELQIRTIDMDDVATKGFAAHWAYRDAASGKNPYAEDPFHWLRELAERVERADETGADDEDFEAFLEDAKREMEIDQIFCFTPMGDVIGLQLGATVLDFAYAIHTNVGHTALAAKIDGERMALSTPLKNGQTVEIIQSEGQRPTPIWYNMVKTGKARAAIRRDLRAQEQADAVGLGKKLAQHAFERAGAVYSAKGMEIAAQKLGYPNIDSVLASVGSAKLTAVQVLDAVYPELSKEQAHIRETAVGRGDPDRPYAVVARGASVRHGGQVKDAEVNSVPVANCCRPLPGERIIALREPEIGFRLHNVNCPNLAAYEDAMERWLDVDWGPEAGAVANNLSTIELVLKNEPGSLGQTCVLFGQFGVNVDNLEFLDRNPDFFRMRVELEVRDIRHLSNIITALNAQPSVADASRRLEVDMIGDEENG